MIHGLTLFKCTEYCKHFMAICAPAVIDWLNRNFICPIFCVNEKNIAPIKLDAIFFILLCNVKKQDLT